MWTDETSTGDRLRNRVAGGTNRVLQRIWGPDLMEAPSVNPDVTLKDVRRLAGAVLPGVSVRRRLLWRYVLVWDKPLEVGAAG